MANDTSKSKQQTTGNQDKQRKQQGGQGGGNQQQQQNPGQTRQQPGREPEIREDMNDNESGSDRSSNRQNIDVERP